MAIKRIILIIGLILPIIFFIQAVDAEISHPHWFPEEVKVGNDVTIYVTISYAVNESLGPARLNISGEHFTLEEVDDDGNGSMLFSADLKFDSNGTKLIIVESENGGVWLMQGSFTIHVEEGSKEKGERTILGLPSWYCSITVIILTVIVIFLTWAYFRGRAMVKAREQGNDGPGMACSDCGKPVGPSETFCPWCGVRLDEDEFLCGKCNHLVGEGDEACGNCGAKLASGSGRRSPPQTKKKGPSLDEKMKVDGKNKRKCEKCGTVLMKDEMDCPVCGK